MINKKAEDREYTEKEIRAINAAIILKNLNEADTACWYCSRSVAGKNGCPKFKTQRDTPVPGSVVRWGMAADGRLAYSVKMCPLFKFQYGRAYPANFLLEILAFWGRVNIRTVWRDVQKYVDIYNQKCPSCPLYLEDPKEPDEEEFDAEYDSVVENI